MAVLCDAADGEQGACAFCSFLFVLYLLTLSGVQFISIGDLSAHEAFVALQRLRRTKTKSNEVLHHEVAEYHDVIQYTGGRLSMLNRVARAHDMLATARDLLEVEKGWLRSQVGLIDDCDDDVCHAVWATTMLRLLIVFCSDGDRSWTSKSGPAALGCS